MDFSFPKDPDDPFKILGVPVDADEKTIKSVYRSLAKRCHPDRNPDQSQAEMRFRQIQQAYETILARRDRFFSAGASMRNVYQDALQADPDLFGGFYWMLKTYLAKKKI